jgi:hypothetical protein
VEDCCGRACGDVTEVLDGHTSLDIQCLDRIYLNELRAEVADLGAGGGVPVRSSEGSVPVAGVVPQAR